MSHIAVPHTVDAIGFLVGGFAVALVFILRMVLLQRDFTGISLLLFAGGSILMLLNSEPFISSVEVAVFYRLVAIFLALVLEFTVVLWVLRGEEIRAYLDHLDELNPT